MVLIEQQLRKTSELRDLPGVGTLGKEICWEEETILYDKAKYIQFWDHLSCLSILERKKHFFFL